MIVQGDTDTTLCGGLATNIYNRGKSIKHKIKLFHVEAGLRSFDENMPEEINRKIVDNLSEYLFVPTKFELNNLKKENLFKFKKIKVVGNTILESLKILERKNLIEYKKKNYFLLTLHRPETVDNKKNFLKLLINLNKIAKKFKTSIIFPIHPRSKKKISNKDLLKLNFIRIIKPVNYLKFISFLKSSKLVLTDSGGIQEECYILNKPCVTIRENTERQVTTFNKSNIISGYKIPKIEASIRFLMNKKINNKNIFGNNISQKIVSEIK